MMLEAKKNKCSKYQEIQRFLKIPKIKCIICLKLNFLVETKKKTTAIICFETLREGIIEKFVYLLNQFVYADWIFYEWMSKCRNHKSMRFIPLL